MRTNLLQYAIALLLCLNVWSGYAQSDFYQEPIPPAPHTADMIRYGRYGAKLFTGGLSLNIPIYTIQDPDFKLSISLIHNADGFKPRKSSGFVGQNWFLQAGGCIHREIKGYADEVSYSEKVPIPTSPLGVLQYNYYPIQGMLVYARSHPHTAEEIFSLASPIYTPVKYLNESITMLSDHPDKTIDCQPDIYHFNFCGHYGSFTINNKGEAVIIRGDFVHVDLQYLQDNGFSDKNGYYCPYPDSKIVVHTLDGYTYTFGGTNESMEYTLAIPSDKEYCNSTQATKADIRAANEINKPVAESWYLTSIEAPNGRKMLFTYRSEDSDMYGWDLKQIYCFNTYRDSHGFAHNTYSTLVKTKQAILTSISIPSTNLTVSFKTVIKENLFNNILSSENPRGSVLLNQVSVACGNRQLCSAQLNYLTRSNSASRKNYWHYLQSVNISGTGTYTMEYDNSLTYPLLDCPSSAYYSKEANKQGYSVNKVHLGLIKKITFPTGGYQTFAFSPHHYTTRQYYVYMPNPARFLYRVDNSVSSNLSGFYIREVKTFDTNNQLIETDNYNYNNGQFYDPDIHGTVIDGLDSAIIIIKGSRFSFYDTFIGYGNVTKTKKLPSGALLEKTDYNFYTGRSTDNTALTDASVLHTYLPWQDVDKTSLAFNGVAFYEPSLMHVGTLMSQTMYITDANGVNSTRKVVYVRNGVPRSNTDFSSPLLVPKNYDTYNEKIALFSRKMNIPVSRMLTYSPDILLQTEEEYSVTGVQQLTRVCYEYDKSKRVTRKLTEGSDGRIYFERYTYPDNLENVRKSSGIGYRKMVEQYRVGTPVETIKGYLDGTTQYVTAGSLSFFSAANGTLEQTSELEISKPIDDYTDVKVESSMIKSAEKSINITRPDSFPTKLFPDTIMSFARYKLIYDSRYRTTCKYVFNSNFQPLSVQPTGQSATTYTWEGIYPASETTLDRTTQYLYEPYIGIKQITDENGLATYYVYDTYGRLTEVYRMRNNKKEILEAYNYNIVTE